MGINSAFKALITLSVVLYWKRN